MGRTRDAAGSAERGAAATRSSRSSRPASAPSRRRALRRRRACARRPPRDAGRTRRAPSDGRRSSLQVPSSRSLSPVAVDYGAVYADHLLLPWHEAVMEQLPGIELFDAHTHTGFNDPDGFSCSAEQLVDGLELAHARAVIFTMQEPDGYPPATEPGTDEAPAADGRRVACC